MEPAQSPLQRDAHASHASDIDPTDPNKPRPSVLPPPPPPPSSSSTTLISPTGRPGNTALVPGPVPVLLPSGSDRVFVLDKTAFASPPPKRRASRAATTYPRKRATQACLTCRFRRTKCDNARPACAACVRLGADCNYQESDPSSFDPASLAILKRLDDLEGLLIRNRSPEPPPPNQDSSTPLSAPHSDLGSSYMVDVWARAKRPLVSVEAVLQWPSFSEYGFPSRLYPTPSVEDEKLSADSSSWRVAVDIDLPAAEAVVRNFFDNVHIFNPILEEEDVQDYIKRVRFEGIGWDAVSCLALLIYAHGTIVTPFVKDTAGGAGPMIVPADFRQSASFHQAESYFLAAQKRMGMLLCRSGVIDAQCFFLAGVYLMSTLRPVEAWKMFVQALACCQAFSIDQQKQQEHENTDSGRPGDHESNPKRRIYWTCFKSELELRLELNPSQKDVWDLTYPAFFPSPPEALKTKDETAWYFYLAEIALMRLKNRILSYLYRSDAPAAPESSSMEYAILDFEEQIEAWLRSLPKPLQLGGNERSDKEQHEALRFILNGHLLDCQEVMYWQFVVDAVHGGQRRGYNAELFLRKGLKVCVDRIRQNRWGFHHRHHGTWLMLRSCTRSSFVLLAAARCPADLTPHLPPDWEEAVLEVAKMLELWKNESADVSQMLAVLETLLGSRMRE